MKKWSTIGSKGIEQLPTLNFTKPIACLVFCNTLSARGLNHHKCFGATTQRLQKIRCTVNVLNSERFEWLEKSSLLEKQVQI
jgi:hypothetical protein